MDISNGAAAAPIVKTFTNILGRAFMIESVEFSAIRNELASLPDTLGKGASAQTRRVKNSDGYAVIPSPRSSEKASLQPGHPLPVGRGEGRGEGRDVDSLAAARANVDSTAQANAAPKRTATRMAKADNLKRPGLVLDYLAELTEPITQAKIFQGDTTYVVADEITCSSTVTIEGGAVFKYPSSSTTACLKLNNTLVCKTSSYCPAIFTAVDDDSVGDVAPNSTGSPSGFYANPAALHLYYLYGPLLSNVRFSYCQEAVRFEQSFQTSGATVSHSQFVNCVKGIVLTGTGGSSGTAIPLTVHNGLMAGVQYPLTANAYVIGNLLYHCTIDQSTTMITATASSDFTFVNSVLANIITLKTGSTVASGHHNEFLSLPAAIWHFSIPSFR